MESALNIIIISGIVFHMIIQPLLFQNIVYNTVFLINMFIMYYVVVCVHVMDVSCCVVCVAMMKIFWCF